MSTVVSSLSDRLTVLVKLGIPYSLAVSHMASGEMSGTDANIIVRVVSLLALLHFVVFGMCGTTVAQNAGLSKLARDDNRQEQSQAISEPDFTYWAKTRIDSHKKSLTSSVPRPIAILTIRRLGLTAPIFDGTDELTLNRGLGRVGGSEGSANGNFAVAGHRDGFFRLLKNIACAIS